MKLLALPLILSVALVGCGEQKKPPATKVAVVLVSVVCDFTNKYTGDTWTEEFRTEAECKQAQKDRIATIERNYNPSQEEIVQNYKDSLDVLEQQTRGRSF